jgi:hypothetical protein
MAQSTPRSEDAWSAARDRLIRRIDECEQAILATLDAHFRRTMILVGLLYLAMLGNIIKDFLR